MNSLLKTVTRQRRDCDLNAGPSAPESSTLSTRLPSHPAYIGKNILHSRIVSFIDGLSERSCVVITAQ